MIKQFNKNDVNELSVIMQIWYESNCDDHLFIELINDYIAGLFIQKMHAIMA